MLDIGFHYELDVNCYVCDELRNDLNLAAHLSSFGIDLNTTQKTCKSLDELQLEQNVVFNFSLSSSDERKYPTIDEVVGITNMGNSCYLAAAIQILMAIPDIRNMYYNLLIHLIYCVGMARQNQKFIIRCAKKIPLYVFRVSLES